MLTHREHSEECLMHKCSESVSYGYNYFHVFTWVCKCQYVNHTEFMNVVKDTTVICTDPLHSLSPFLSRK